MARHAPLKQASSLARHHFWRILIHIVWQFKIFGAWKSSGNLKAFIEDLRNPLLRSSGISGPGTKKYARNLDSHLLSNSDATQNISCITTRLLLKLLKYLFFETLLSKQACFYWWLGHLAHIEVSQQLHVKPRRGNSNAHNTERTLIIADHCGFIQLISYLLRSLEQNLSTWTCAK